MAVRVGDNLKPSNDSTEFPVAFGDVIWLNKDKSGATDNFDSLQNMYNNDELGNGGSSIQVDTMPIASAENENMILQYVGASGTYQNGYFYQNIGSGDPKVYSWVQKNVQPSNATATDVSYDNTTSELVATNVQDAIDEIKGGLGTASGKNFTDLVRPNSHELVESGSVYSAINNALSSIYTPRGKLTCAELTSSLLIEDNVGNIYTMSDSGTTSALFINGAGLTINVGDNVGIIKAGADTYLFNYMGNAFDLTDYQKKDLSSPIAGASTVEGALSALNNGKVTKYNYTMVGTASLEDDIKTFVTDLIALGANTYVGFFNRSGSLGTAGNYSITIYAEEGTSTFASGYIALGAGALGKTQYIVSYYKPTGSSEEWTIKKLATTDDILENNYNGSFMGATVAWFKTSNLFAYPNAGGFWSSTFLLSDRNGAWTGILKLADDGAGSVTATIVSLGGSPRGGEEFYYDETSYCLYFCGTWDRITITQLTGKKVDLSITSTTQEEAKQNIKIVPTVLATTENLTNITLSDYQLSVGGDNYAWFDLGTSTSTSNSQAFLFYEITYGRVDGSQSKILISCSGTMADLNYIKVVNLNDTQTSAAEQLKLDSNKHIWLGMQSYCYAHIKVYGHWSGMGIKTTVEPTGIVLPIYKLVTESDLAIKKKDISAKGGATSFSTTIPLSMARRNIPFYLEVLSVGNNNAIKEMKYLVFVSSLNTIVTTKEISKDSIFTNVSITFNESTGYELSFSSTDTLYSTTIYIQQ